VPDPFFESSIDFIDATALPVDWTGYELEVTIDGGWVGQTLQFGFASTANNSEPSGNFYDNINFGELVPPGCEADIVLTGQLDPGTYEASNSATLQDATADLGTGGDPINVNAPTVIFDGSNAGVVAGGVFTASNVGCVPPSDNLAENGDFETGDFTGWAQFEATPGDQTVSTDNPNGGTYAGRINNTQPASASLFKQANVGIGTVMPTQTVYISFSARGTLAAGGVAFAEFFSELSGGGTSSSAILGGGPLAVNGDPNVWTPFTFTETTGADVSGGVTLQLTGTTGGDPSSVADMFYDDICISVIPGVCFP
jgi:hypothetical protein